MKLSDSARLALQTFDVHKMSQNQADFMALLVEILTHVLNIEAKLNGLQEPFPDKNATELEGFGKKQ